MADKEDRAGEIREQLLDAAERLVAIQGQPPDPANPLEKMMKKDGAETPPAAPPS